jgi:hypothetical protein
MQEYGHTLIIYDTAFPWQQWLPKCASMLCYLYVARFVITAYVAWGVQVTLVLCQGYVPEKCANWIQNSHLKQLYFLGVRGLTSLHYVVYDYTISGHMDV